jgi:branched-chain amino acid transport system ATP-binding protein
VTVHTVPEIAEGGEILRLSGVSIGYGGHPVVSDLNLRLDAGEVVGLLGANGAGKTTTLLGIVGELPLVCGAMSLFGDRARGPLHTRARRGVGYVGEERSVIFGLSVLNNIRLARGEVDLAFEIFPELRQLQRQLAGRLSGGEQQMLAFARALSRRPRLLVADELSLGLAPLVVERLTIAIRDVAATGVGVLLVEQQVLTALATADRAYVLRSGKVVLEGTSDELMNRLDEVEGEYLSG